MPRSHGVRQKIPCEFCGQPIAKGGAMETHIHFKHLEEVLERFRQHPAIVHFAAVYRIERGLLLPEKCHA